MKRLTLLLLSVVAVFVMYSQETKKVSTSYTYFAPETMSVDEAKRTALERAKIQAIANEFGSVVSHSSSTVVSNANGESDTRFFSVGGSDVRGEWIETIGEPKYEIRFENHFLIVACSIKGIIRENTTKIIDFEFKILCNGTDPKNERSNFMDGDDMYVSFQSPHNGFLTIYWIDYGLNQAYRILPYINSDKALARIRKDKPYIFFSSQQSVDEEPCVVDEFTTTCNNRNERNSIYVIFSDKQYNIPNVKSSTNGIKYVDLNDFHNWTSKLKRNQPNITIKNNEITISKR